VTEPAGISAESGLSLDRSDTLAGGEPVPLPGAAPHTTYSALKQVALEITAAPSPVTTVSHATVRATGAMPSGSAWMYLTSSTYVSQLSAASTLSTGASGGASTILTVNSFVVNDQIQIDTGAPAELRTVVGVTGSGPYTLTLDRVLGNNHATGTAVARFASAAPADVAAEASGNQPSVAGGYTLPTLSAVTYAALGVTTGTTGRLGAFLRLVGAVSSAFGTSPGTVTLPSLIIGYDEA
jgi:hypothetical protein